MTPESACTALRVEATRAVGLQLREQLGGRREIFMIVLQRARGRGQ